VRSDAGHKIRPSISDRAIFAGRGVDMSAHNVSVVSVRSSRCVAEVSYNLHSPGSAFIRMATYAVVLTRFGRPHRVAYFGAHRMSIKIWRAGLVL
jgi:hypothetical protein